MRTPRAVLACLLLAPALGCSGCTSPAAKTSEPQKSEAPREVVWRPWSNAIFEQARSEKKLVLLDLGTGWCHWCHVMEETTYKDPAVKAILAESFVVSRVDADGRPDLANRYEDYGWPATILFDGKGTELAKRRGYIAPREMEAMLRAFVADPTPGPSALAGAKPFTPAAKGALDDALRAELLERHAKGWDEEKGGWGTIHKFPEPENLELALRLALAGDEKEAAHARRTLELERTKLIDPVWGGAYQYSDSGDWEHPHFEKIMARQACDLELFALGSQVFDAKENLEAARAIERYLVTFLSSPEGAFYPTQDADLVKGEHSGEYFAKDDAGRRKLGVPEVDKHVYARENGWAIEGLCWLYAATGDEKTLARAVRAAGQLDVVTRQPWPGGFCHDCLGEREPGECDLYLGDTLAMGRAFLRLHLVTGEPKWLERATAAAHFINATFWTDAGYVSAKTKAVIAAPLPQLDENVSLARFANLLRHVTGDESYSVIARRAMRYAASPDASARRGIYTAGILLADRELAEDPLHVTVAGDPAAPATRALLAAALAIPSSYVVVERDPKAEEPSALVCVRGACRAPVHDPEALAKLVRECLRER
jgi:uncharacterized protein YyaL (SSP411 family)